MPKLEASLRNRRVIEDGNETLRVGHHDFVKQRFIAIHESNQIDIAVKVGKFVFQVIEDPHYLAINVFDFFRQKTIQSIFLAFCFRERRPFVTRGIVQECGRGGNRRRKLTCGRCGHKCGSPQVERDGWRPSLTEGSSNHTNDGTRMTSSTYVEENWKVAPFSIKTK